MEERVLDLDRFLLPEQSVLHTVHVRQSPGLE